jgi:hypothetical protein
MPPGSASLHEIKALMEGREARAGGGEARAGGGEARAGGGEARAGGPLCEETRRDLKDIVEWADSDARHQANVGRVFGLRCVENEADGNCFFESLQQFFRDIGHPASRDSVSRIRNRLVDALAGAREQDIGFMTSDNSDMHFN